MKKSISILGSTGSIGESTLNIISHNKNFFSINILMAKSNYTKISKQIKRFKPKYFIIKDIRVFNKIKKNFKKSKTKIFNDFNNLKKIRNDITVSSVSGIAGLEPTIFFAYRSKKILLANKESIICGWHILKKVLKKYNTKLIPIDSEHFSLMKLIEFEKDEIEKIYITASGGPFFGKKRKKNIKPSEALNHPKWTMGRKISIDSATLMNKIFELEEARLLFPKHSKKMSIILHPQSLVHAIIKLKNGLYKFIYHSPDMRIPIANALYDSKININSIFRKKRNDILGNIDLIKISKKNFPPIKFISLINRYNSSPIIINAANEILVDNFLRKTINFRSILKYLTLVLAEKKYKKYAIKKPKNIKGIMNIDKWARETTLKLIKK